VALQPKQQLGNGLGAEEHLRKQGIHRQSRVRHRNRAAAFTPCRFLRDKKTDFTRLDSMITAAYDSYLPWLKSQLPALLKAMGRCARLSDPLKARLAIQTTRKRYAPGISWAVASVKTYLAVLFCGRRHRRSRTR